jgi:DegV family protein with EDD domain
LTPQLEERLNATSVPLTLRLGNEEFVDDETLDLKAFMIDMATCTEAVGTAAPAPGLWKKAIEEAKTSFVVALSSKLSGSYESAVMGLSLTERDDDIDAHIFDTKSASAGELLVAVKIRELLQNGLPKEQIIQGINEFIDNMKTYFVLDRYDNLQKNGRLPKVAGKLITVLNIKLVMGDDGFGGIALHGRARGAKQIISTLVSYIDKSGKQTEGESLVVSHCNNLGLARKLVDAIEQKYRFKEIFIVPTGGVSSLYADNGGIVMAF